MKLYEALGLTGGKTVAFVGAGGKTSAMITLASELSPPVVMTTTTHLGAWQAALAERHEIISSPDALKNIDFTTSESILLTGPLDEGDRLRGVDPATLEALHASCCDLGIYLLIEADGARQLPLKAPADYEPVIPAWVDHVVVLAGLTGLGKPLDDRTVHRPEVFSRLGQLPAGEPVGVVHAARVLASQQGGLKGIPEKASRYLFLNQAEGDITQARGACLANRLMGLYDRILIGSLAQPNQEGSIFSAISKTAGIILAAGGSERLGQPKQLLDWCGMPFVVQVVQSALAAALDPVIVVTGANRAEIEAALAGLPIRCVYNPAWASGQSTSMKVGLDALPDRCDRVMFLLSDQPQISPNLIRQVIAQNNITRKPITAPMTRERRGNPVLFGKETFEALSTVSGDQGGRAVFQTFNVEHIPWIDDRILLDVDQLSDLDMLNERYFVFEHAEAEDNTSHKPNN